MLKIFWKIAHVLIICVNAEQPVHRNVENIGTKAGLFF